MGPADSEALSKPGRFVAGLVFRILLLAWIAFPFCPEASDYFGIRVVDEESGRGIPLAELSSVHQVKHWTDSQGWVAIGEPGWRGREVYFHLRSDGYEIPRDGFGYAGFKVRVLPGQRHTVRMRRTQLAERMYRITGEGIYRDSVLLGLKVPIREPLLNGLVLGQDTVIAVPFRGRLHWFWGDTERLSYPLGHFGAAGATSALPGSKGFDVERGIELSYFVDGGGFSRPMCPEPNHGLRWIESVFTLEHGGREHLMARVAHHKDLGPALGWYLMKFDEKRGGFEVDTAWDWHEGHDSAHPFQHRCQQKDYLYLYPNYRVLAELEEVRRLERYEAWTCVAGDGKLKGELTEIDRDSSGAAVYSWKPGADRLHKGRLRELTRWGKIKPEEQWLRLRDVDSGKEVEGGRGSVAWNAHRNRWIMLASGEAGEIWYSECEQPTGPWTQAKKVASHLDYNFYNPVHHSFLDREGGRVIYFEGTYTASFSRAQSKTPRYDYNQVLYRLRLDDSRLRFSGTGLGVK